MNTKHRGSTPPVHRVPGLRGINVRNLPDDVRQRIAEAAAARRMSVEGYVKQFLIEQFSKSQGKA